MQLPNVLRGRGFQLLLAGQTVSALGDWLGTFALMALTLELSGSPTAVGGILVLRLLPSAVAGPVATRLTAGWDRKRTMIAMDVVRAGMVAAVPFVRAVWWVYVWALLLELASLVFLPARDAAVPDLVDEEDLSTANGLVLASSYGNIPVGAAAFALIAWATGRAGGFLADHPHSVALFVDAGTFLVSWALLQGLPDLGGGGPEGDEGAAVPPTRFREAFRHPVIRAVMPGAATVFAGVGALFTLGIPYVQEVLDASDVEFGWLVALFGAGGLIGLASSRGYGEGQALEPIRRSVLLLGAVLAGMSLTSWLWAAYLGAVAFGAAATFALVSAMTFLQTRLDGRERVLGFTAFHVLLRICMSLAAIGAGLAAETFDSVRVPGTSARLDAPAAVLFVAGLIVLFGSTLLRGDSTTTGGQRARDDHHRQRSVDPGTPDRRA